MWHFWTNRFSETACDRCLVLLVATSAIAGTGLLCSRIAKNHAAWRHFICLTALLCISVAIVVVFALPAELQWRVFNQSYARSPQETDIHIAGSLPPRSIVLNESTLKSIPFSESDSSDESSPRLSFPINSESSGLAADLSRVGNETKVQSANEILNFREKASPKWQQKFIAIALLIWIAGGLFAVLRMFFGLLRLRSIVSRSLSVAIDKKMERKICRRFGLTTGLRVRTSNRVVGPIQVGLLRSTTVFPPHVYDTISRSQLQDVLMHEAAHFVRGDGWVLLLEQIVKCILWPNLLVVRLCRHLDFAREELCDNLVLRSQNPVTYGETLLRIAEMVCSKRTASSGMIGFLNSPAELKSRVEAILDNDRVRAATVDGKRAWAISIVAYVGVALLCSLSFQAQSANASPVPPKQNADVQSEVIIAESETADPKTASEIRMRLEYWESEIDKGVLPPFHRDSAVQSAFLDAWSEIDLMNAVAIDRKLATGRSYHQRTRLLLLLAKNHRWGEIERIQSETPTFAFSWLQFWVEVASLANDDDDLIRIDKAVEQIRRIATTLQASGTAGMDESQAAVAEFLSLEAKVEYLHRRVLKNPNDENNLKSISQCLNAMNRCTGRVNLFQDNRPVPIKLFYDSQAGIRSLQQYVLLEAWDVVKAEEQWGQSWRTMSPEVHERVTKRRGLLKEVIDQRIEWQRLELPPLGSSVVAAWLFRQIAIGQHDVALTYLTCADGTDADFASLLAILSRGYLNCDVRKARHCREVASGYAKQFLDELRTDSNGKNRKLTVAEAEALCETALSFLAAGESELGEELVGKCFANWPELASDDYESVGELRNLAADAALSLKLPPDSIPFELKQATKFWTTSIDQPKPLYWTRGTDRQANTSTRFPSTLQQPSASHPEHAKYYALKESKDWLNLLLEVQRLATRNSAWQSSYSQVGQWSAMDIGLEKTLEWSSKIEDPSTRMSVEMGAIRALLPSAKRMFRSEVNRSPSMIAPGISWPTNGC